MAFARKDQRPYPVQRSAGSLDCGKENQHNERGMAPVTQLVDLTSPTRRRRGGPRGPVFVWANVVVLGWLAVAVALLAVHELFAFPVWVA